MTEPHRRPYGNPSNNAITHSQENNKMSSRKATVAMIFPSAALDNEAVVRALAMDSDLTESQAHSGLMLNKEDTLRLNPMKDHEGLTFLTGVPAPASGRLPNFEAALIDADMAFDTRAHLPDLGISNSRWRPGMGERAQDANPNLGGNDPSSMTHFGQAREHAQARNDDASSMAMD
jgi:hypothetical protein